MRHTRQGCARGQSHGTLDRDDPDLGSPGPWAKSGLGGEAERGVLRSWPTWNPGRTLTEGTGGCWCHQGPVGHHDPDNLGLPHPGTRHGALEDLARAMADEQARRLDEAGAAALLAGVGTLVLVAPGGRALWAGPHPSVPLGETHWRAQAPGESW